MNHSKIGKRLERHRDVSHKRTAEDGSRMTFEIPGRRKDILRFLSSAFDDLGICVDGVSEKDHRVLFAVVPEDDSVSENAI